MEIISRADAKKAGLKTYFTDAPCKNGHKSYRYVQSGTCSQCINGDRITTKDPNLAARREAKAQMIQVRLRIFDDDREHVGAALWALAVMRWPELTQGDVDPRLLPKDKTAGTGLYSFNCHDDDLATAREIAAQSLKSRRVDVEARRAEVLSRLQATGGNL